MSGTTLQHHDTDLEIHEVVVGPVDNNVYVLRCRHTGDAVLIDAANEHEQLLELCRELKVGRVLETHGHWDHIQAVPQLRDAGYSVGVSAADAEMLDSYDEIIEHDSVIEVGDLRLRTILTPGHTPGSMCFRVEGKPLLFSGDTLSRRAGQHHVSRRRLPDHHHFDRGPALLAVVGGHDRHAGPWPRHHHRRRTPTSRRLGLPGLVSGW